MKYRKSNRSIHTDDRKELEIEKISFFLVGGGGDIRKSFQFCSRKYNNYPQIIWKITYIPTLFSHLRHTVYKLRRYGRPTCAMIFTRSSICRTQVVQILCCIDKAHKRSFTEVALNSVLEDCH